MLSIVKMLEVLPMSPHSDMNAHQELPAAYVHLVGFHLLRESLRLFPWVSELFTNGTQQNRPT